MRWRRVRRVTTRLAMIFVTFAACASAGIPPLAWVHNKHHEPRPGATNSGRTCFAAARRCPRLFGRPALFPPPPAPPPPPPPRPPSPLSSARAPRSTVPLSPPCPVGGRLPPARQPDHPNRCSRRSPGPIHCPCPGAVLSRHLRRGAPRTFACFVGSARAFAFLVESAGIFTFLLEPAGTSAFLVESSRAVGRPGRLVRGVVPSASPACPAGGARTTSGVRRYGPAGIVVLTCPSGPS